MNRATIPSDRRAFGRRESRIHAIARIPGRGSEPCVVRNFSDSGALLAFSSSFEPPARFRLSVEAKGIEVMCEVRRRNGCEVGVSFVDGDQAGTRLLDEPAHAPSEAGLEPPVLASPPGPPSASLLKQDWLITVVPGDDVRRQYLG